jgi:HEAT repeat protein
MTDRLLLLAHDPRLRRLDGKLEVVNELRLAQSEKAVPLLLELVCDGSWRVREEAASALAERGAEVVPALIGLVADGLWYTRAAVAQALGRIGELAAVEALVKRLDDDHANVRQAAVAALQAIAARHGAGPVATALAAARIDPARLGPAGGPLSRVLTGEEGSASGSDRSES